MIEIRKPEQKPVVVIRAATGNELSNYEKQKLANIEENAQENKIEIIKVNDQRLQIDPVNKEVNIKLGNLAFKSSVTANDISAEELFFIKCELDDADLKTKTNE
jgi:predicted metalloprotease with PDZ domain